MKPSELYTKITNQTGLFNIQAIDNIPSIMQRGLLSNKRASKIMHTSIAMQEVQERRDAVVIPNGMALHKYANVQKLCKLPINIEIYAPFGTSPKEITSELRNGLSGRQGGVFTFHNGAEVSTKLIQLNIDLRE